MTPTLFRMYAHVAILLIGFLTLAFCVVIREPFNGALAMLAAYGIGAFVRPSPHAEMLERRRMAEINESEGA
jgi:hypothetical protein